MSVQVGSRAGAPGRDDLVGYRVEAVGGTCGSVDASTRDASDPYLVVNVRRWPASRKVVVPATAVNCVDRAGRRVWVQRDRDGVRNATAFDPQRHTVPGGAG